MKCETDKIHLYKNFKSDKKDTYNICWRFLDILIIFLDIFDLKFSVVQSTPYIFSCEDAAQQVLMYVCPSVRLSEFQSL